MRGITRRFFLKFLAGAAVFGRWAGEARAFFVREFPVRTVEIEDFGFDAATGSVTRAAGPAEPYVLAVDGLVARPQRLSYADLLALPRHEQVSDFHCVEGWSVGDLAWGGLRLESLASLAGPLPEARYVVFHSLGRTRSRPEGLDHYVECLPLADLLDPDLAYLLALTLGGAPLPLSHGAPLRLVCPFDLAYKGAKFVARLEFAAAPVEGWWTRANGIYETVAPVEPGRLRRPDPRASARRS